MLQFGYLHCVLRTSPSGLTSSIQLTEYGAAAPPSLTTKEDARSALIAARARRGEYDDELILEQLARNRVFLSDAGLSKLRSSFVIVVGLGVVEGTACTDEVAAT